MEQKKLETAAVEINEIMRHAPDSILKKYPHNIDLYFKNLESHTTYTWKYDITKKLYEQALSDTTKKILFYLYRNYFCDNDKKEILEKAIKLKKYNNEIKKNKKYPKNPF